MVIGKSSKRPYGSFALLVTLALVASFVVATVAYAGVSAGVVGDTATSTGAGSEKTGDGRAFKNKKKGTFIKMRSGQGDFEAQTRQARYGKMKAVAVKVNDDGDRVIYDAKTDSLTLNGNFILVRDGFPMNIVNGGKIENLAGDAYAITSEAGDKVTVTDNGGTVNLKVEAGPNRADGDLRGSLGQFDSDTDPNNDLVNRNGVVVANVGAFLEGWRVQPGESMFG